MEEVRGGVKGGRSEFRPGLKFVARRFENCNGKKGEKKAMSFGGSGTRKGGGEKKTTWKTAGAMMKKIGGKREKSWGSVVTQKIRTKTKGEAPGTHPHPG